MGTSGSTNQLIDPLAGYVVSLGEAGDRLAGLVCGDDLLVAVGWGHGFGFRGIGIQCVGVPSI